MRNRNLLLVVLAFGLTMTACGPFSSLSAPTVTSTSLPEVRPSATSIPTPTATETPAPTFTVPPLDPTPTVQAGLVPVDPATPQAAPATPAGDQPVTPDQISALVLSDCQTPSDPPAQDYKGIPVMPQATAGQVIYTPGGAFYCFRAPVTVEEVLAFYSEQLPAPEWDMYPVQEGSILIFNLLQIEYNHVVLVYQPLDGDNLLVGLNVVFEPGVTPPAP